jgi:hypothetical protein
MCVRPSKLMPISMLPILTSHRLSSTVPSTTFHLCYSFKRKLFWRQIKIICLTHACLINAPEHVNMLNLNLFHSPNSPIHQDSTCYTSSWCNPLNKKTIASHLSCCETIVPVPSHSSRENTSTSSEVMAHTSAFHSKMEPWNHPKIRPADGSIFQFED